MKKFLIVLGIVVVSLACIAIINNLIIKSMVTTVVSHIVGAPVHMNDLSLNLVSSTIRISGFKVFNPRGFPEGVLISCPKINIIFDRTTLLKEKRHFLLMEIEIKEVGLIKNKEGKLNIDSLKIVQQPNSSSLIPMQIDLLNVSIGSIKYSDSTAVTDQGLRVYDVNRCKIYKSISTAQQLFLLILAEPLKAAAIKNAEIYGVASVAGVAELPVSVVATSIGKDSVHQIIDVSFEHVYEVSFEEIKRIGTIMKYDALSGVINANINGALVTLTLKKGSGNKTEITISARKFALPQLDIAAWVLYQIIDTLQ